MFMADFPLLCPSFLKFFEKGKNSLTFATLAKSETSKAPGDEHFSYGHFEPVFPSLVLPVIPVGIVTHGENGLDIFLSLMLVSFL
jgi:hypothetical protein